MVEFNNIDIKEICTVSFFRINKKVLFNYKKWMEKIEYGKCYT